MLASFSGYIAADELYDGPFCVLSIVDNRTFRRITYEVLDHDPTHTDMERFFRLIGRRHSTLCDPFFQRRNLVIGKQAPFRRHS